MRPATVPLVVEGQQDETDGAGEWDRKAPELVATFALGDLGAAALPEFLRQFSPSEGFGIVALLPTGKPPTHTTTGLLPLRLSPDPNAVVVAELAPGVALLAGAEQDNMRRVRFNQAHGHNEGNDFWVTAQDISSRTKPAPAK